MDLSYNHDTSSFRFAISLTLNDVIIISFRQRASSVDSSPIIFVRLSLKDLHTLSIKNHYLASWIVLYIIDMPIVVSTIVIRREDLRRRQMLRLHVHMQGDSHSIPTTIGTYACDKVSSSLSRSSGGVGYLGKIKSFGRKPF